jgi:hypothetical protein
LFLSLLSFSLFLLWLSVLMSVITTHLIYR